MAGWGMLYDTHGVEAAGTTSEAVNGPRFLGCYNARSGVITSKIHKISGTLLRSIAQCVIGDVKQFTEV